MRAPLSTSPSARALLSLSLFAASACAPAPPPPAPPAVARSPERGPLFARSRALPPPCAAPAAPPDDAVCGTQDTPCVVLSRTPLAGWHVSGLELAGGQPVLSTLGRSGLLVVEQGRFVHHPAPTDGQLFVRGGSPWWVRVGGGAAPSHAYRFDGKRFELPVEWPGSVWGFTADAGGCLHGFQAEQDGTQSYVRLAPDGGREIVRDVFPGVRVRAARYLVDGAGGVLLAQRLPGGAEAGYMRPEGAPLLVEAGAHMVVFGGAEPHFLVQRPEGVLAHVRVAGGRRVERVLFRPEEKELPGGLVSRRDGRWLQGLSTAASFRAIYATTTLRGHVECEAPDLHPDDGAMPGAAPPGTPPAGSAQPGPIPGSGTQPGSKPSDSAQPATPPDGSAQPATPPDGSAQPATPPSAAAQPATPPDGAAQPATPPDGGAMPGGGRCFLRDGAIVGGALFIVGPGGEPVPLPLSAPVRDERGAAGPHLLSPRLDAEGRIHAVSGTDYVVLGAAGQPVAEVAPPPPPVPRRLSNTIRIPLVSARALFDAGWAHTRPGGPTEDFVDGAYRARSAVLGTWYGAEHVDVAATPWFMELDLRSVAGRAAAGCFGFSLHVADDRFDADLGIDEAGVTLRARLAVQGGPPGSLHHAASLARGTKIRLERTDTRVALAVGGVVVAAGPVSAFPRVAGVPPLLLVALETRPCGAVEASAVELRYGPLSGPVAARR